EVSDRKPGDLLPQELPLGSGRLEPPSHGAIGFFKDDQEDPVQEAGPSAQGPVQSHGARLVDPLQDRIRQQVDSLRSKCRSQSRQKLTIELSASASEITTPKSVSSAWDMLVCR